jgi:UDP-xylose/UDP-N-acetylglucosamine transporter B4
MERVNSTTVNLVLTIRKAVSLAISVWFYGSGANAGLLTGGAMVLGPFIYILDSRQG